jgi:hypothetical protein
MDKLNTNDHLLKNAVSDSDCDKGYRGDCCCNCKRQVKINCHPSNGGINEDGSSRGSIETKGSIDKTFGWGCECFRGMSDGSDNNQIIFMDTPHGMCEMHERL